LLFSLIVFSYSSPRKLSPPKTPYTPSATGQTGDKNKKDSALTHALQSQISLGKFSPPKIVAGIVAGSFNNS
jgi:hypothetical protein